jgi:hypothetical protein
VHLKAVTFKMNNLLHFLLECFALAFQSFYVRKLMPKYKKKNNFDKSGQVYMTQQECKEKKTSEKSCVKINSRTFFSLPLTYTLRNKQKICVSLK